MISLLLAALVSFVLAFILMPLILGIARLFGLYTIVNEATCHVYVLFGKVVAVLTEPGRFAIHGVPDCPLYAFAMGFGWSNDPLAYLRNDSALRASALPAVLNKDAGGELLLHLRPPELSDPPIVVAIPALVAARLAHAHHKENLVIA